MQTPGLIPNGTRKLLVSLLFPGLLWLLVSMLEPLARGGWLGPVPARNLELGFDAGALFYTEVDLSELRGPVKMENSPIRSMENDSR